MCLCVYVCVYLQACSYYTGRYFIHYAVLIIYVICACLLLWFIYNLAAFIDTGGLCYVIIEV